jgi:predicted ATPase
VKKRIVITGGPGTGKSSIIKNLEREGYECFHEISREITAAAQREGVAQLFLAQPLLFSQKLLEARISQYHAATAIPGNIVFIDRGIPDVVAYMEYFGTSYPPEFIEACSSYKYDKVFLLPPWQEIYLTDNERYESFDQAVKIYEQLKLSYLSNGYSTIEVPKDSVGRRSEFILKNL